jgi:anti-sigma regulatory factor (Ser/Thr protein kinase)
MDRERRRGDPVRPDDREGYDMIVLGRDMRSVGRARHWLRTFLDSQVGGGQLDDAVLVVSELVTNALRHGLGDVVLRASVDQDASVRLSVTDSGPEQPRLLPADPHRIGGVGLRIVDDLARSWGVSTFPGGKTTWAVIGV